MHIFAFEHVKKLPEFFFETEGSLPHSQEPATCPHPEPDRSNLCPHPTYRRSILILSYRLRPRLASGLLPSGFPTKLTAWSSWFWGWTRCVYCEVGSVFLCIFMYFYTDLGYEQDGEYVKQNGILPWCVPDMAVARAQAQDAALAQAPPLAPGSWWSSPPAPRGPHSHHRHHPHWSTRHPHSRWCRASRSRADTRLFQQMQKPRRWRE